MCIRDRPGDASKVISVANGDDGSSMIDGTEVEIDGVPGNYGSSRAALYDWETKPDLAGPVVRPPGDNLTGCDPYPPGTFSGEVVLVDWDNVDIRCGTIALSGNLEAAGAGGFILGSNTEKLVADINGSETIPGVIMVASAADALRNALAGSQEVVVTGTSATSVNQSFPEDVDRIVPSTARGLHAAGNVKPDVTAVGGSIFSAEVGSATGGSNKTGTSMASPMVAGLAALVHEAEPAWTPLQVKADIMNTATHDLTVNGSLGPPSPVFSPVRVGAGRVDAAQAVNNDVLAYNPEGGAVSVSFGPVEVDGPVTLKEEVTVQNTGASAATYEASYDAITTVPGVQYSVSPSQFTVAPGASETVDVTLGINDPGELTKSVDPTVGRTSSELELPRETLAEAAGRLLLEPEVTGPTLRVPVYAAPRPVADMGQADSLKLKGGETQTADLDLEGSGLGQHGTNGTGNADPEDDIFSVAAGFELTATSGLSPNCGGNVTWRCLRLPGERAGDIKYVGFTSSFPYRNPSASRGYFAISTHAPFSVPAGKFLFQVEIDVDGDHKTDLYLINNRLVSANGQNEEVLVSQLLKPDSEQVGGLLGMNARLGDVDTALFDSDTLVLPFQTGALAAFGINPGNPRINYGVSTFSSFSDQAIDLVGIDPATGDLELSADLFEPGIQVGADRDGAPLLVDSDGTNLKVTGDASSYKEDGAKGLLMVHFHNGNGNKAQPVDVEFADPGVRGPHISARVTSAKRKNRRGWYRTPVTVTFTCSVGDAPLVNRCPKRVTLRKDGARRSVSRTISAADGTSDTVRVGGLKIDRTRPKVRIKGVHKGARYRRAPKGRCAARDRTSKISWCRLKRKRRGNRVVYTASAKDRAGNVARLKVRARIRR